MTQVAFLRAINVGGRSVVKMRDVVAAFSAAGAADVRTVLASGNVLFEAPGPPAPALRARIGRELQRVLGTEPVVVYRSLRNLQTIVDEEPFGALAADRLVKLYVAFLTARPKVMTSFPLRWPQESLEAIGMARGDVLIVSRRKPNGMYGFPANWIEKELGVPATARNWSTVTRIAALAIPSPS